MKYQEEEAKNTLLIYNFLIEEFSLIQMIDFYTQKYYEGSKFLVLESLSYFSDANVPTIQNVFRIRLGNLQAKNYGRTYKNSRK